MDFDRAIVFGHRSLRQDDSQLVLLKADDMNQNTPRTMRCESAIVSQLPQVQNFLAPFFELQLLLPRTGEDLSKLLQLAFIAWSDENIVGFAAVEIYSRKLAEIQCLAVHPEYRGCGVGQELVSNCVAAAKKENVLELMAISAADSLFTRCGFDYSLPNQKRALFISPLDT